jgi:hypothetical protein
LSTHLRLGFPSGLFLYSLLLSKPVSMKIHTTTILSVLLYVCNLKFHSKRRTQIEDVWQKGAKEDRWWKIAEYFIMGTFIICIVHEILLDWGGQSM